MSTAVDTIHSIEFIIPKKFYILNILKSCFKTEKENRFSIKHSSPHNTPPPYYPHSPPYANTESNHPC